jgi:membrane protein CcdC involved in cytochrome C biogenesis
MKRTGNIQAMPHLNILSLISSVVGAIVVLMWRVRETRRPVSTKSIVIPPLGMATGFSMFIVPMFRVPLTWGVGAFVAGALALAYPLVRTSRLVREGDVVMLHRSNVFFAVLIVLAGIRIAARGYFDHVLTVQQTAGLFFVLAFGMILRWRMQMFFDYRALVAERIATP